MKIEVTKPSALIGGAMIIAMGLVGCGSDGGSDPQVPTGLSLELSAEDLILGDTVEIEAGILYGRESAECDWYVEGVLGGSTETGTISQDNPAVYTAPVADPGQASVEITAVLRSDESVDGSANLGLLIPEVQVHFLQDTIQVAETVEVRAGLAADRSIHDFDWYVNGVLGGMAETGTISQDNPAVYSAPDEVPGEGRIEIRADWRDNPDFSAGDSLDVLFTIKHVNASTGVNEPGRGQVDAPFKTITYALDDDGTVAGDIVLVAPGVYDHALGEDNSISTPYNVTIRGVDRDQCFVDGNPAHDGAIFYMNGTTIENFTLRNPGYPESGMRYGIQFQSMGAVARNIKINDAFLNSAIYVTNTNRNPYITDCEFVCTQAPGAEDGIKCNYNTRPSLVNCVVSGWNRGIQAADSMLIEGCTITDNGTGVRINSGAASPDLGGGPWGGLGGNTFHSNDYGVSNNSDLDVYARFNTWSADPPLQGPDTPCDIYNQGAGTVIWE